MKKAYIFVPIIGALIFAGIYWNFRSNYASVERAKVQAAQKVKDDKQAKEVADRKKAYEDAIAQQERRKKEKEEKETKDRGDREARQSLVDLRDRSFREQERQSRQVARLKDERKAEKEGVDDLQTQIKGHQSEIAAQQTYVTQAQANEKNFEQVLTKIEAVDKAAEAAAAAAKAVANKAKT